MKSGIKSRGEKAYAATAPAAGLCAVYPPSPQPFLLSAYAYACDSIPPTAARIPVAYHGPKLGEALPQSPRHLSWPGKGHKGAVAVKAAGRPATSARLWCAIVIANTVSLFRHRPQVAAGGRARGEGMSWGGGNPPLPAVAWARVVPGERRPHAVSASLRLADGLRPAPG